MRMDKMAGPKKAVAYYRVSTDKQGIRGLGMEAQQESVRKFADLYEYEITDEFVEVESGKKDKRIQLALAMECCRIKKSTLVIAKLDRLSRDLHFITGLIKDKIKFKAVDMPEATKIMLQMHGLMAEWERDMISARTSAALQALKQQGKKLGPKNKLVWEDNIRASREFAIKIKPTIQSLNDQGIVSGRKIAAALNERKIPTFTGSGKWHLATVQTVLKHLNSWESVTDEI